MTDEQVPDFRQHLVLETPEHALLDLEIAGVGSRVLAAVVDWVIVIITLTLVFLALATFGAASRLVVIGALLLGFVLFCGYFALFEGFWHGQTPGKRMLGIRVIRDSGHGITLAEAAVRNLLLPIDLLGMLGVLMIALHPRGRRLGDLAAGTVVVRDRPAPTAIETTPFAEPVGEPGDLGSPVLTDEEFRLLHEFVRRAGALPSSVRDRFAGDLAQRFAGHLATISGDALRRLGRLHADEVARRQGRFGGRASGASAGSVMERLLARKNGRWTEFETLAQRVTRGGLGALEAAELPDFAARYREVAADLSRARTYGADPVTLLRLERLVAAGHNAIYRAERRTWGRVRRYLLDECPATVMRNWRVVLLAFACFAAPAAGGFALLRERPALAEELLPDVMLERAETGVTRRAGGKGYLEAEPGDRPVLAAAIITNNIRVAFAAFASGIFLGVGSLVALAFNGLLLGAASGHFANVGVLGYLWAFVAGHGMLELFAIWLAGAAGFLLGGALILPGDRSRPDALVAAAREAIRLVTAAALLLVVAGSIEGLISASAWSVALRLAVSGGSLGLLGIYLWHGARVARASSG